MSKKRKKEEKLEKHKLNESYKLSNNKKPHKITLYEADGITSIHP